MLMMITITIPYLNTFWDLVLLVIIWEIFIITDVFLAIPNKTRFLIFTFILIILILRMGFGFLFMWLCILLEVPFLKWLDISLALFSYFRRFFCFFLFNRNGLKYSLDFLSVTITFSQCFYKIHLRFFINILHPQFLPNTIFPLCKIKFHWLKYYNLTLFILLFW